MRAVLEELLQGSYAILMTQLRRELQPGLHVSRLEADDFVRFLQLARFFHRYVRLKTVHHVYCIQTHVPCYCDTVRHCACAGTTQSYTTATTPHVTIDHRHGQLHNE